MSEWEIEQSDQFTRDWKKMLKRYPREAKQVLANLMEYKPSLEQHGNPLRLVEYSFVHRETSGCHAITQPRISMIESAPNSKASWSVIIKYVEATQRPFKAVLEDGSTVSFSKPALPKRRPGRQKKASACA